MAACGDTTTPKGGLSTTTSPSASTTAGAEPEVTVVSDVLYQEDPDGTQHAFTAYAPGVEGGPWPVALMIHGLGGGMAPTASEVASQGVVAFVPAWETPAFVPSPTFSVLARVAERPLVPISPMNAPGVQAPVPQPYQGFSSGSTCRPSMSLLKPPNRSTTAMSSRTASSSNPSFCTAEVWTCSQ